MHISNLAQWKLYQMATYILCLRPTGHVRLFSFLLLIVVVHYCSRTFVISSLPCPSLCSSLFHLPLSLALTLYSQLATPLPFFHWKHAPAKVLAPGATYSVVPVDEKFTVSTAGARSIRDPNHCSNTPSKDNHTCGNRQCDSTTGDGTRSGDQNHSRGKNNTNGGCYVLVLPGDDLPPGAPPGPRPKRAVNSLIGS